MTWEEACSILGILPTASTAEIRKQYLYKANLLHSDKTVNLPPSMREKADEEFKKVNAANDFLKDPQNRPNNSPPKLHISLSHVRFNVDPGQKKNTTFKINNTGGPYTSFWMDDSPAPWLRVAEVKSLTDAPLPIEVTIEATGIGPSSGNLECFLPIKIENDLTKTKDEAKLKIELKIKSSVVKPPTPPTKLQKWVIALILIASISILGWGISLAIGNYISLWVFLGFSIIFSIEKWFDNITKKYKGIGKVYRLLLNISILSLLGLLIWSGIQLFSQQFFQSSIIGSFVFIGEFVLFIWLWRVVAKNSWRWPSMKLTIFSLIILFLVVAYARVSPFMELKDSFLALFNKE